MKIRDTIKDFIANFGAPSVINKRVVSDCPCSCPPIQCVIYYYKKCKKDCKE